MEEEPTQVEETTEETPQNQTTDNQAEVARLTEELAKKDSDNLKLQQTVTRHANREKKLTDNMETDRAQISELQTSQAQILDYLEELRGDTTTEAPKKTSHVDELKKSREAKPKEEVPPDVAKFMEYLNQNNLTMKDSTVMEAVQNREPDEALTYLIDKKNTDFESKVTERAKKEAAVQVQQILKEMGVAKSEGSPSGTNQDDDTFMREFSEGKSDDYQRMEKLLKKMK